MSRLKASTIAVQNRLLQDRIKRSLFHLVPSSVVEFQRFAHEYSFAPNMTLGLRAVEKRGPTPKTIIDVGAFEGQWSRLARDIWPNSRVIMIEPNLAASKTIARVARDLDARLFCELLGATDGQPVQFTLMESGSSVSRAKRSAAKR